MNEESEQNVGSTLNQKQRAALARIVEQRAGKPAGDISQTNVRVRMLWEIYLRSLQAEVEAIDNPERKLPKGSTANTRRDTLRTLKNHIGRPPAVEDLISSFAAEIKIDGQLVEVLRLDLATLQQRAKRRGRLEMLDAKIKNIEDRRAKATGAKSATKSLSVKKGSKK